MNRKMVMQFLILTFAIAFITCGICLAFFLVEFSMENAAWLYIFVAICAFSPTIASFLILKKNKEISSFKEWLKNIFNLKAPLKHYFLVVFLLLVCYIPKIVFLGFNSSVPFYQFFLLLPIALIFGGIEEAGWSYVLRPELNKKFSFVFTALIVAVIWSFWHIPVFLPQGRISSLAWFCLFAATCLGESFALTAIIKITNNVFLCVMFHTLSNAISGIISDYSNSFLGNVPSAVILILTSIVLVAASNKDKTTNI